MKNALNNYDNMSRLKKLIQSKFLDNKILFQLTPNIHYEIFKYLTAGELFYVRLINLGGFQLIMNLNLRKRIHNITPRLGGNNVANILRSNTLTKLQKEGRIQFIFWFGCFESIDLDIVNNYGIMIGECGAKYIAQNLKYTPMLLRIILGI